MKKSFVPAAEAGKAGSVHHSGAVSRCGECRHFTGGGDFDLCCDLPHPEVPFGFLCYEHTAACGCFERKTTEK